MGRPYKVIETAEGDRLLRFLFAYDDERPGLLHISARDRTTVEDAIDTFFRGQPQWNDAKQWFETNTETHGLLWYWLAEGTEVMVISCSRQ